MKTQLIAACLFLISSAASAEMKVTVNVTLEGLSVTISNISPDDVEDDKLKDLLSKTVKQAKQGWKCDLHNRC